MKIYLATIISILLLSGCCEKIEISKTKSSCAPIYPDYNNIEIPINIAPLNFTINGKVDKIDAVATAASSYNIHLQSSNCIKFPIKQWRKLLSESQNDTLTIEICAKQNGYWTKYAPTKIFVSNDSIDYGLVYRKIAPGYEVYSSMGIYERDLSCFDEKAIVENTMLDRNCVNCHSFCQNSPKEMSMHIRGSLGSTLITNGSEMQLYNTYTDSTKGNCVYPYWHPNGRYIAYSINRTQQIFHAANPKRVEVYDHWSDIVVYDTQTNELASSPLLRDTTSLETFPAFSPDGKWLYFCTAQEKTSKHNTDSIRYDLCRISFDETNCCFGTNVDTLVHASAKGRSVSFPRPSPNGKYLIYTLSNHGQFSIWHPEADLYLLDLASNESRPMTTINSDNVESYHSWTSNGKWIVFSSRRENGLYTQPYFSHIDDNGNASKPFLLPQEKPQYYNETLKSFNIPEFITAPTDINAIQIEAIAHKTEKRQMKFKR